MTGRSQLSGHCLLHQDHIINVVVADQHWQTEMFNILGTPLGGFYSRMTLTLTCWILAWWYILYSLSRTDLTTAHEHIVHEGVPETHHSGRPSKVVSSAGHTEEGHSNAGVATCRSVPTGKGLVLSGDWESAGLTVRETNSIRNTGRTLHSTH